MKKIVITAGDTSGDLYGGFLSKRIKEQSGSCEIYSFGGGKLAENSRQVIDLVSHSVCGLLEVISSLGTFKRLFRQTAAAIENIKPDLVILIDFPDFNLRLAKKLNRKYPVFYYISPQVWAWRKNRVKILKKYARRMVPIFKFEEGLYRKENMAVSYFGHPLLEIIKNKKIEPKKVISFLPGSRKNEIKKHLKVLSRSKEILTEKLPGYEFRIIKPLRLDKNIYKKFFAEEEIFNHSYQILAESEFIVTACGTTTLELAILEIPHLIIYKVNCLTWHILKKLVNTEFAGMANILAKKEIVPEFLQNRANPENISRLTYKYLTSPQSYRQFKKRLAGIKKELAPDTAITSFARYICQYLQLK